jgi:colicin import membrane protein
MTWVAALREHAKITGKFMVPKKGTPEYDAVKKIQDGMANPTPEVKAVAAVKTKEHKERKVAAAVAAQPSAEEIAAKHAAEKAAAKVEAAKAKAEATAAKAAAKVSKLAKEEADAAAAKAKPKPKPNTKQILVPEGPLVAKAPVRKPKIKIAEGSGVSVKADPVVSFN